MRRPPRPRGAVRVYQERPALWIVEARYPDSAIRDVLDTRPTEAAARAAFEFFDLVNADDELFRLQREGEEIAHEHFRAGWLSGTDT